jgi:uncharacterized coiled-coil DUF342 family protein
MRRLLAMVVTGAFAVAACGDDDGGSVESFCAAVEELASSLETEPTDAPDIETMNEQLNELQSDIEAVADAAPDEISEEIDTIVTASREQFDAFRQMDELTDEQFAAAFDNPAFSEEASAEIDAAQEAANAYALEECGVDLG